MSYAEFFLKSSSSIRELETIQISHPSFSKVYSCVRNARLGLAATIENGSLVTFDYYPMAIKFNGAQDDLDYGITITFGDLGEVIPAELDNVTTANTFGIKPMITYRTFRSDVLTAPMFVAKLQVTTFSFTKEGCSFDAAAPSLNLVSTGEVYAIDRFPMLRGLL